MWGTKSKHARSYTKVGRAEDCTPLPAPGQCVNSGCFGLVDGWPQAGPASGLSNSASKFPNAGGDVVLFTEPNMCAADKGEVGHNLPGSKSVARAEGDARNWGGPESSCRTNYESQAGKDPQNKGVGPEDTQGVRLAHSTGGSVGRGRHVNAVRTGNQSRKNDGARLANLPAGHSREGQASPSSIGSETCIGSLIKTYCACVSTACGRMQPVAWTG